MTDRVKLIWDFRGPNAAPIAEHHVKHLLEYANSERLENAKCDIEKISDMHCIAFMVVDKELMNVLRESLKPHRGQNYIET